MSDSKAGVLDAHSARVTETNLASRGLWLVKVGMMMMMMMLLVYYLKLNKQINNKW